MGSLIETYVVKKRRKYVNMYLLSTYAEMIGWKCDMFNVKLMQQIVK